MAAAAPPRGRVDFRFSRLHELGNPERAHAATAAAQARCGRKVSFSDPCLTLDQRRFLPMLNSCMT